MLVPADSTTSQLLSRLIRAEVLACIDSHEIHALERKIFDGMIELAEDRDEDLRALALARGFVARALREIADDWERACEANQWWRYDNAICAEVDVK